MIFHWTPISERQIRLLQRKGLTVAGELSYDLHVFDSENVPPYAAISYMCGPAPDDKVIYINDLEVHVRQNCLDALQQVQQHDESEYIWLDCICINQVDLEEKSRQIQSMGRIYREAEVVLACVGYGDGVPALYSLKEAISTLKSIADFNVSGPRKMMTSPRYRPWLDSLPQSRIKELTRELNALGALPYWNRLWIIQEIHLGKKIKLCVGKMSLEWRGVASLHISMQTKADMENGGFANNFYSFIERRDAVSGFDEWLDFGGFARLIDGEDLYKSRQYDFDDALKTFKDAKCSLPHDRIYAIRELIKWPQTLGPMIPDYHLDPFDLAQEALRYLRADHCEEKGFEDRDTIEIAAALLEGLSIDLNNALLSSKMSELKIPLDVSSEAAAVSDILEHHRECHSGWTRCSSHHPFCVKYHYMAKLDCDEHGRFVAEVEGIDDDAGPFSYFESLGLLSSNTEDGVTTRSLTTPIPLHWSDTIIGWITRHARIGDYLANIWRDEGEPSLVLRPVTETALFQIVGVCMLRRGAAFSKCSFPPKNSQLILHFDPIDLLTFTAQYCRYDQEDAITQLQIAKTFLRNCNARVTRSPFSSYALLHLEPEHTGSITYRWSKERGWQKGV